jgi:hypothetical protein
VVAQRLRDERRERLRAKLEPFVSCGLEILNKVEHGSPDELRASVGKASRLIEERSVTLSLEVGGHDLLLQFHEAVTEIERAAQATEMYSDLRRGGQAPEAQLKKLSDDMLATRRAAGQAINDFGLAALRRVTALDAPVEAPPRWLQRRLVAAGAHLRSWAQKLQSGS